LTTVAPGCCNAGVKLSEQLKAVVQDVVRSEFRALRAFMTGEFGFLRAQLHALRRLTLAEFDRLESRLDGRRREPWRRKPCQRVRRGCRGLRRS
jgi:hypothetical protein